MSSNRPGEHPLPVALLAGGLATRLRPVTEKIPKSLVDVAGQPFVHRQLRLLRARGMRRVVICAGHLGDMIRDAVGDGSVFGLDVVYSFDHPRPLGTAGALKLAEPLLGDAFFVLYGDSYLECDYLAVQRAFHQSGQPALMTVYENRDAHDASNVVFVDNRIAVYDKRQHTPAMRHIDYGLGVLTPAALAEVPPGKPCDLADVYASLLADGWLAGFEVRERFYEIGSPAGLAELAGRFAPDGATEGNLYDGHGIGDHPGIQ